MTNTQPAPTARVQVAEIVTDLAGDRWVRFEGSHLFKNADQDDERLTRAELADRYGPLTPYGPAATMLTQHDPSAPAMGQHVSAVFRGEAVTGTVTSLAFGAPADGVHPLDVVHLHLDAPVSGPTGRSYDLVYLDGDALATIKAL
jgi:hypothetical protein